MFFDAQLISLDRYKRTTRFDIPCKPLYEQHWKRDIVFLTWKESIFVNFL